MKKASKLLVASLLTITLVGCGTQKPPVTESTKPDSSNTPTSDTVDTSVPDSQVEPEPELPEVDADVGFTIHFDNAKMENGKYLYNLWLWSDDNTMPGEDYQFNGTDSYGAYARYQFVDFPKTLINSKLGFIVKQNKPWAENPAKDVDGDRFLDFSEIERDKYGYYNIYLKSKDPEIYTTADGKIKEKITHFNVDYNAVDGYYILMKTNVAFDDFEITKNGVVIFNMTIGADSLIEESTTMRLYHIGNDLPDFKDSYHLKVTFENTTLEQEIDYSPLYSSAEFDALYTYQGELGALYTKEKTTFRVWSPISSSVKLKIYDNGTPASLGGDDLFTEYDMVPGEKGTFEKTLDADMAGKYYTYVVTNPFFQEEEVVDPYAKSCGLNGLRGMVVDFAQTNPTGWEDVTLHNYDSTQLTVYETHIADLTSSKTWNGTSAKAKTYQGFAEEGTTYTKDEVTVKTGFDHIKELAPNAVQLLPIFDQANDEREENREFNWGYNPLNYNCLEGSYSSDPSDGYARIKEFKSLVQSYNKAGINIIMDVVYNHVNGLDDSNFNILMPKYYFRYNQGKASNGSGCGNETASEMPMYRKFMIDSTSFWAKEYKLGGFRFDLMGLHDLETMNMLTKNLHDNVNPSLTVYGEPWTGGTSALEKPSANQGSIINYQGFGQFNDQMRDNLIRGGLSAVTDKGWITDTARVSSIMGMQNGIVGKTLNYKTEPYKTVNYVTCHDNYTLHDRIQKAGIKDPETIKKMAMLANSVVFTSQGITFMLAGEEFLRTKNGNGNSYNASYEVNALNYDLKVKNLDMFKNYQKLLALKQKKELFGKTREEIDENIVIHKNKNYSLIWYDVTDTVNNVTYRIAHTNGVKADDKFVDFAGYELYLDTLNANTVLSDTTPLQNFQTIIASKKL